MTYKEAKAMARKLAIDWKNEASQTDISYVELEYACKIFNKIGKRFGLLGEFRENGIPC